MFLVGGCNNLVVDACERLWMWVCGIDAAMRGWLKDARSYVPPVQIGETMRSSGLATVVEVGEGCDLVKGDIVTCTPGSPRSCPYLSFGGH